MWNRVLQVVDKTLVKWVLPDFTTSTWQDVTICSVQLMSTLKSYVSHFRYKSVQPETR